MDSEKSDSLDIGSTCHNSNVLCYVIFQDIQNASPKFEKMCQGSCCTGKLYNMFV